MKAIRIITLHGGQGLTAQISNYGAKVLSLVVPDNQGVAKDVVLGFKTMEEWQQKETYFNAIIGRYANRIKDGRFTLDGKTYQLPINNGTNSLHGGVHGFNEKVWNIVGQTRYSVSLHYRAADGEEGYPGNLDVYVTYTLTKDNALSIQYEAKTDQPTILGFTNHAYFNLAGEGSGTVHNHILQIFADNYTPFDDTACPTGEILPVEGTPMDFRQPTRVGDRVDDPFFAPGRGIDNNWVLRKTMNDKKEAQLAAVVEADGRKMEVWTTMPGLQVYTGNWVEQNEGKSGAMYNVQHAICLEAQSFPDSPNHPNFPNTVLRPGEVYYEKTLYRFVTK
ncbi:MAG: galactose mutarotase [Paludibacteraceae bacterium]|nr:galactose mutarotase [Paludibacteraceae bacterium]